MGDSVRRRSWLAPVDEVGSFHIACRSKFPLERAAGLSDSPTSRGRNAGCSNTSAHMAARLRPAGFLSKGRSRVSSTWEVHDVDAALLRSAHPGGPGVPSLPRTGRPPPGDRSVGGL